MDELPSVALVAVLDHLPYGDLVGCRLVNKLWRHLIDRSVSKRELILFVEMHRLPNWWQHSGEPVNLEHSVQANYRAFKSATFFAIFKGVKRLFLSFNYFYFNQKLTDKLARNFGSLENLQIDYQFTHSLQDSSREFRLPLRSLKTFSLPKQLLHINNRAFTFSLDCDRLTQLYANTDLTLESNSLIARVAPNLRVLFAGRINYEAPLEFPNLKLLWCYNAPGTQFLVTSLPNLSEFYFATQFVGAPTEAKHPISEFLERIKEAHRKMDVFWYGMKFTLENLDSNLDALAVRPSFAPAVLLKTLNYFKENASILNFNHLRYASKFRVDCSDWMNIGEAQLDEHADRELIDSLRKSLNSVLLRSSKSELNVAKLANLFQFVSKLYFTGLFRPTDLQALPTIFPNLRTLHCIPTSAMHMDPSFFSRFKHLSLLGVFDSLVSRAALDQMLTKCQHLVLVNIQGKQKHFRIRIVYKHVKPSRCGFRLRFLSPFSPTKNSFKENDELLAILDRNEMLLKE